jgi:sulfite exporter TauE/SafE
MSIVGYWWVGFAGGAAAFAHCLGMCGGFALYLSHGGSRWRALGRQALWHGGQTFTYVFLGTLFGFGGATVSRAAEAVPAVQRVAACFIGVAIAFMGLLLMGVMPRRRRRPEGEEDRPLLADVFRRFFAGPTAGGAFVLGLATGFIPCPIVYAFLAVAAASKSALAGAVTMAAMGLGTIWSLLLLGLTGHLLNQRLRRWGAVVSGLVLVLLGIMTVLRGVGVMQRIMGHHHRAQTSEEVMASHGGASPAAGPPRGH